MADASDSKSDDGNIVRVQVPPPAPKQKDRFTDCETVFFCVASGKPGALAVSACADEFLYRALPSFPFPLSSFRFFHDIMKVRKF